MRLQLFYISKASAAAVSTDIFVTVAPKSAHYLSVGRLTDLCVLA